MRTREEPQTSEFGVIAALGRPNGGACNYTTGQITYPVSYIFGTLGGESGPGFAFWKTITEFSEEPVTEAEQASDVRNGTTVSLLAASTELENLPYTCAVIAIAHYEGENPKPVAVDEISFPIAAATEKVAPPPPPAPPAPGALSIPKLKTLKLKTGKWKKVHVKVSDTGAGPTGPVALKVKAHPGVALRVGSGTLAIPALAPAQTWTVSFWVKLTEKAKPKSKIALTAATQSGLSAKSDLVIRALG